jgi:hypothetical protein
MIEDMQNLERVNTLSELNAKSCILRKGSIGNIFQSDDPKK